MPRKELTTTEFARRLEKARKAGNNSYKIGDTASMALPIPRDLIRRGENGRQWLEKPRRRRIPRPEVI